MGMEKRLTLTHTHKQAFKHNAQRRQAKQARSTRGAGLERRLAGVVSYWWWWWGWGCRAGWMGKRDSGGWVGFKLGGWLAGWYGPGGRSVYIARRVCVCAE